MWTVFIPVGNGTGVGDYQQVETVQNNLSPSLL